MVIAVQGQCYILVWFKINDVMKKYGCEAFYNSRDNDELIKIQINRKILKMLMLSVFCKTRNCKMSCDDCLSFQRLLTKLPEDTKMRVCKI
jgi:hypothetical protein